MPLVLTGGTSGIPEHARALLRKLECRHASDHPRSPVESVRSVSHFPPAAGSRPSSWLTRERLCVAGLLVFTALVRGGVLWAMRDNLEGDPDLYREIAENVLQHGIYGRGKTAPPTHTAYRPPLYPIALTNFTTKDGEHLSLGKVAVFHVLLGMATVWLTYLTARRLSSPTFHMGRIEEQTSPPASEFTGGQCRWCSLARAECGPPLAALLVACDPILLYQQTLIMTETLAALLAILSLWCLVRFSHDRSWWTAGLAGGAIGLAALCRPTFLPWLGLVGLVVISDFRFQISDWHSRVRHSLPNSLALALVAAVVMAPWAVRNHRVFGKPILATTHGGYTLWLGNNASFFAWLRSGNSNVPWDVKRDRSREQIMEETMLRLNLLFRIRDNPDAVKGRPVEVIEDRFHAALAKKSIQNDPHGFVLACWYRIGQLWSPLPNKLSADESAGRRALRYLTATWYGGVYLLAAVGVWWLRWRLFEQPWVWGVLLCLALTAVHTLYWSNLRMRAPLMPFVAIVAAAGVAQRGVRGE